MRLYLVVFECYSELLQLIENTKNLESIYQNINYQPYKLCIMFCGNLGRANFSSFVAMKKNGTVYVNPDGNPSNRDVVVNGTTGDCVVFKDGSLLSAVCDQPAFFICENKLVKRFKEEF
jgi:hypothetical protein